MREGVRQSHRWRKVTWDRGGEGERGSEGEREQEREGER